MAKEVASPRLNAEWLGLTAIRDVISRGARQPQHYDDALEFAEALAPTLYSTSRRLIASGREPKDVRRIRQIAAAMSAQQGRRVQPVDVADEEIQRHEGLLKAAVDDVDELQRELTKLRTAREFLTRKRTTENASIVRDFMSQEGLPRPRFIRTSHIGYDVGKGRQLSVLLLHPDVPEKITGADVVYDICDTRSKTAQVCFLQYKIWDKDALYFSTSKNLHSQIKRLETFVCENKVCAQSTKSRHYRLPHCAAFLRPTDRLQTIDAKLKTSAEHIPICALAELTGGPLTGTSILRRSDLHSSLTVDTFSELLTRGMIGSRPLPFAHLEEIYRDANIVGKGEHIFIHAQERETT